MRLYLRDFLFLLTILFAMTVSKHQAGAAPLDKNACAALAQEMQNLQTLNVQKLMERGPEWAVGNLSPGDLHIVRRFIEVDEQVKFRCTPASALVRLQGLDEDEEDDVKPEANAKLETGTAAETAKKPDDGEGAPTPPAAPKRPAPKAQKVQTGQTLPQKPVQANFGAPKPKTLTPLATKPLSAKPLPNNPVP